MASKPQEIGYIDARLLEPVRLTAGALPWHRDKRLKSVAEGTWFFGAA